MINKGLLFVVVIWGITVGISYVFFLPKAEFLSSESQDRQPLVDAIVLIAMGQMAEDSMIDYSIASIRKIGNWKRDIYVLTDRQNCFKETAINYDLKLVEIQPLSSIIMIKALKPKLMSYLPASVHGALYLDVDILVTRDLGPFLTDLKDTVTRNIAINMKKNAMNKNNLDKNVLGNISNSTFDYGAFLDAKGHYVGFCSGCEKWHTGVVWLQRDQKQNVTVKKVQKEIETVGVTTSTGASSVNMECLKVWEKILLSGKYNTDQESMDEAERVGACSRTLILPSKHLLFAKDYIGMVMTSGQTFLHLTAAGRIKSQDFFYREIVVPRLRNSLRPMINPSILKVKKSC